MKDLDARCSPKHVAQTNIEMKEQMAEDARCRHTAMVALLDETLVPMKTSDLARFHLLMGLQARFNEYERDACWLAEEAFWVDFDAGTRDDGTARSTPTLGCEIGMATERWFFARALAAQSASSIAARATELAAAGERTIRRLAAMREASARLARTAPGDASDALDASARHELADRVKAVDGARAELATATCAAWPELDRLLAARCADALALYYAAHVDYDEKP